MNLPDDLMKAVKLRALHDNRSLQDTISDLLRKGLDAPLTSPSTRVQFPLIVGIHPAPADHDLTPERVSEILLQQEADDLTR